MNQHSTQVVMVQGAGHIGQPNSVRPGGGLVPFDARCACPSGWRRPSVRLNRKLAVQLVQVFPPHQQVGTYRCPDCHTLVALTVGSIDLSAPATSPV